MKNIKLIGCSDAEANVRRFEETEALLLEALMRRVKLE